MKLKRLFLDALIDVSPDEGVIPCLRCPELARHSSGQVRRWDYGTCQAGWLPEPVTMAALEIAPSKFGRGIRKLARLCPHALAQQGGAQGYIIMAHIITTQPERTLRARLTLMVQSLPFTTSIQLWLNAITGE